MNTNRHELDREAAERLLDGGPGDPRAASGALAAVLAAASAPARDAELAGEDVAVSAFQVAAAGRSAAAQEPPRRRRRGAGPVRLVPAKIAAVVLATATAAGGMALAGRVMGLPANPLSPDEERPAPTVSPDEAKSPVAPGSGPHPESGEPSSKASRRAAMVNLCRAYQGAEPSKRVQQLGRPPLRALADAAGGAHRVPEFCAGLAPPGKAKGRQGTTPAQSKGPAANATKNRSGKGPENGNNADPGNGKGKGKGRENPLPQGNPRVTDQEKPQGGRPQSKPGEPASGGGAHPGGRSAGSGR